MSGLHSLTFQEIDVKEGSDNQHNTLTKTTTVCLMGPTNPSRNDTSADLLLAPYTHHGMAYVLPCNSLEQKEKPGKKWQATCHHKS